VRVSKVRSTTKQSRRQSGLALSTISQWWEKKEPSPLYHARQIPLKLRSSDTQAGIHSHTLLLEKGFLFSFIHFFSFLPGRRNGMRKENNSRPQYVCVNVFLYKWRFFSLFDQPALIPISGLQARRPLLLLMPVSRKAVASVWNFYERPLCSHYARDWIIWMVPKYFPEWKVKSSSALSSVLLLYVMWKAPQEFSSWSAAAARELLFL
jgi:hypothetical protein